MDLAGHAEKEQAWASVSWVEEMQQLVAVYDGAEVIFGVEVFYSLLTKARGSSTGWLSWVWEGCEQQWLLLTVVL